MNRPSSPDRLLFHESHRAGARKKRNGWLLTLLIFAGLVLGAIAGEVVHSLGPESDLHQSLLLGFDFVGSTLFMGLLKMTIIPLIISSVVAGVASIGDFRKLGRIGAKTLLYYLVTMFIAAVIGLALVTLIEPGGSIETDRLARAEQEFGGNTAVQEKLEKGPGGFGPAMMTIVKQMIPVNPIAAAADPSLNALPVIVFSIFFGILLTTIGRKRDVVVSFVDAVFEVMTRMVHVIIYLAPIGVFCLVAMSVGRIGFAAYGGSMLQYVLTVMIGLIIHGAIVLPLILWLFGRTNPYIFMWQMRRALMTAFGTDSSSATLPVTLEDAIEQGKCSKKAAGFVIPLGATVNMDGTALFESVAVVFIAQSYGVHLGIEQLAIVAITAVITAVGVAGIPSGSLVLMPVIIGAVNNSLGGSAAIPIAGLGLILGVDRLLDMSRTTVNVWGDAVGAKIITRTEPDRTGTEYLRERAGDRDDW